MNQSSQRTPLSTIRRTAATLSPSGATASQSRRAQLRDLRNRLVARGLGVLGVRPCVDGAFGILMYHRVATPLATFSAPTYNVSPAQFRLQMEGLLALGYRAWPLRKVLACHHAMQPVPPKTFVVTFDDGYESVYDGAYPVLREHGIPATVFLATAFLDSPDPFPFDHWRWAGAPGVPSSMWRPIRSAQCEEMLASGLVELGAHTHIHSDFRGRPEDLRRDLAVSLNVLRTRFGVNEATFAFPFGHGCRRQDGPELSLAAKEAGTLCALTTDSEMIRLQDDPFDWGRFTSLDSDSAASLAAKLDGRYSLARSVWRRLWRRTGCQCQPAGKSALG